MTGRKRTIGARALVVVLALTACSGAGTSRDVPSGTAAPIGTVVASPGLISTNIVPAIACPELQGTEAAEASGDEITAAVRAITGADVARLSELTDPSYWPELRDRRPTPVTVQIRAESVASGPAAASPYASLLGTHCGQEIVARSWWAGVCPDGPFSICQARSPALIGHMYFIRRGGRLLLWFLYP